MIKYILFQSSTGSAAAKPLQSCSTLCDPIDGSPPGSPIPGILQARTLEWVAISFANAWKWKVKVKSLSRVWLLATPWTAAHQAPLSMGFFRQEYWIGLPLPSPINKAQNLWENKRYPKREITEKKWEAKGKGEKERFAHLKAEFQRIARGLIPGSGRSPGEENGNPLQYSCLENYIDWGAWLATVHEVTELNTDNCACLLPYMAKVTLQVWLYQRFSETNFYGHIGDLECYFSFYCWAKWVSYTYTYIHSF